MATGAAVAVAPCAPWREGAAANTATPLMTPDASSLRIVPTASPSATVAPTTFVIRSAKVSLASARVSPFTGTAMVVAVTPAAMVRPVRVVAT